MRQLLSTIFIFFLRRQLVRNAVVFHNTTTTVNIVVRNCNFKEEEKTACVCFHSKKYRKMTWRSRFETYFLGIIHIFSYFNAPHLQLWNFFHDADSLISEYIEIACVANALFLVFFEISSSIFRIIYGKRY